MKFEILYFSGTGCTKLAAEKLKKSLEDLGNQINMKNVDSESYKELYCQFDGLIIMYPVHAFGAPNIMNSAVKNLGRSYSGKNAVIISVSAGGEVNANNGCRLKMKRELSKAGFRTVFEEMVTMPCNWASRTPDEKARNQIEQLNTQSTSMAATIVNCVRNNTPVAEKSIPITNRIMVGLGTFSRTCAFRLMGKCYKADEKCTSCGICAVNCPVGNVKMKDNKPKFGWRCIICMRCIYSCPTGAIKAGIFDFIRIKDGFDINRYMD